MLSLAPDPTILQPGDPVRCPACQSADIRKNEIGSYFWCGACGHHIPMPQATEEKQP